MTKAETAKIKKLTQSFQKAFLAGDWAKVASHYTTNAVLNPPHHPALKGRKAIRAFLETFPPVTAFHLRDVQIEARGDLAYVLGKYTMAVLPPGAPGPVKDSGKYLDVRRKGSDGQWLFHVDMFNSDLPSKPAQTA